MGNIMCRFTTPVMVIDHTFAYYQKHWHIHVYIYIYIQTSKCSHYVNRCEFLHSMVQKLHVLDFCVTVAEMLKSVDKTT